MNNLTILHQNSVNCQIYLDKTQISSGPIYDYLNRNFVSIKTEEHKDVEF